MPTADSIAARLASLFKVFGQNAVITHGGSPITLRCRVSVLNLSVRDVYFTYTETDAWASPAYQLTVPGDCTSSLAAGDAVALPNGATGLTVRRWDRAYLGDGVVKTLIFVAANA